MAAPKGNQFWKIRSKHGRDKLFATPELLLTAAYEYFEWCDNNPWLKNETTVKPAGVESKETPTARPYTISGLCIYLHASEFWWKEFRKGAGNNKDFLPIITHIEDIIRTQKFEGAMVGAFNANIVARDLGLKDVQEIITPDTKIIVQNKADSKKISDILSKFDNEE